MNPRIPEQLLPVGKKLHGFLITRVIPLPEIRAVAYGADHPQSGAHLLHLHTFDPENLFAIGFRTPPPDNSGLPHILEHTVLCGSRKYPVKDPFVELLKTSLATFLNAMTYPDRTLYPCASMNEKDFFNLTGVYCDAVFYPRIGREHFKQEGHHFEFEDPSDPETPLVIKGVVYNEMKGVYSDLDGIIEREIPKNLFPDNAYGYDFGGEPEAITALTYERFKEYHRTRYHPSNSLIFIYGDIPTTRHLEFLDREFLRHFTRETIDTSIAVQPPWTEPRRSTRAYPIGGNENPEKKAVVAAAFRAGRNNRPVETLALHLLSDYLLGNAASPLRKALIDSKLGEELTDSGYSSFQRDTYFTVGLKGTEPDRADAILDLILRTCSEVAARGVDREKMESAFHHLELSAREIKSAYPIRLMDRAFESWASAGDPILWMHINRHIAEARRQYEAGPGFFEERLRRMVPDNPHRVLLTFQPDPSYTAGQEKREQRRLEEIKARLSSAERERIVREAAELGLLQSEPNSPQDLATLPRLSLSDVPVEPLKLDTAVEEVSGRPFLVTDMFSNGITYLALSFDLLGLDEDALGYLPLFTDALGGMGAAGFDYAEMAEREAACSGGVESDIMIAGTAEDHLIVQPRLLVFCSALDRKLPRMLEMLRQRLTLCDFADLRRLKDVILQGRIALRSRVIRSGNSFAVSYASRGFSANCALSESMKGVSAVRLYEDLAGRFDRESGLVGERLSTVRDALQNRNRLTAVVLGSPDSVTAVREWYRGLLEGMDANPPGDGRGEVFPENRTAGGDRRPRGHRVRGPEPAVGPLHPSRRPGSFAPGPGHQFRLSLGKGAGERGRLWLRRFL